MSSKLYAYMTFDQMVAEFGIQSCISKAIEAITECNDYIRKEGARSADSRPAQAQRTLDGYIAHKAELRAHLLALMKLQAAAA